MIAHIDMTTLKIVIEDGNCWHSQLALYF